jgi:MerR family transcriptional regulator/heat shock protein HspR
MAKEFWTLSEVVAVFEIDESFVEELETEEIVCPLCKEGSPDKLFSNQDMERVRIARTLYEDMGVNFAGVEVILRMRETVFEMRRQFDEILEDVARELRDSLQ